MLRAHCFHRLGVLRLAVFDVLRLVERDGVEFQPAIFFRIAANERVTRHDNVVGGNFAEVRVPIWSVQCEDF